MVDTTDEWILSRTGIARRHLAGANQTARKLHFPMERIIVTVGEHGNISAASVPLALDVGIRDGRIKPRDLLLLEAFGGGFTWGSALLRL
jgi:3-oxoacyl-[acyl-carrier-protein] synthase-3